MRQQNNLPPAGWSWKERQPSCALRNAIALQSGKTPDTSWPDLEERRANLQKEYDEITSQLWEEYGLTRREAEQSCSRPEDAQQARRPSERGEILHQNARLCQCGGRGRIQGGQHAPPVPLLPDRQMRKPAGTACCT